MGWNVSPAQEELAFLMEAGFLYRDLKQHSRAREVFDGVRALAPRSEVPEVAMGTVSLEQGEFDQAEKHYRRALELNPRSAYAYAHLGELTLFRMDREGARPHLRQALELDPGGQYGKMARDLLELADVIQFK
jgi:tetratricopeptide (TPR) repeat protein